ncbi:MAG: hypothetical protein H0W50_08615 [Parachlamydiaceae bacterium]|nr:hypothetical protein [Parachlamydiaceae bacterium]
MDENNYQTCEISPDFSVGIDEMPVKLGLSDAKESQVDQIWEEAQQNHEGQLFNGKFFVFKSFENGELTGHFIDYKYFRAQSLPALKSALNIKPIAISCSCRFQNEFLIGLRSKSVTGFSGFYELVPSGGISLDAFEKGKIDLKKQALLELEEEAGIFSECVKSCLPVALIHEINASTYEIYMEIELKKKGGLGVWSTLEYSMLEWMPIKQLISFAEKEKEKFVPLSLYLIEQYVSKLRSSKL